MIYTIKSEQLSVKIDSHGAELISAIGADGFEYIWQAPRAELWDGHSPVLFPHCGKILGSEYTVGGKTYKMGAHGFAKLSEFEVASRSDSALVLELKANESTKEIYPFDFVLTADFKVEKNRLFANFSVQNDGKTVMPYMFGWHPGFTLDTSRGHKIGDFVLSFDDVDCVRWHDVINGGFVDAKGVDYPLENSAYPLCEREIYEHDTMIFVGVNDRARLAAEGCPHGIDMSWSGNLPYFCIWKMPTSEANFVCLEPWSNIPGDGLTPENFDTKAMSRLDANASDCYRYSISFN